MTLQEILNITNFISSKEQNGNTLTPLQYNNLLPFVVDSVYNTYIYAGFDKTQRFTDASLPFKVFMGQESYVDGNNVTIPAIAPLMIDANGYAPIPSDYKHYSALKYKKITNKPNCKIKISHRDIYVLTDQEYDGYANSSLKHASHKYPVCNMQNGFIRFQPKDLQYANFVYLKYPKTPKYAYTIDQNTQEVIYDSVNSVELEFRLEEQFKVIGELLKVIGVNLSDATIQSYATEQQQKNVIV